MKRKIVLALFLCLFFNALPAQIQSGLVLSGGRGNITTDVASGSRTDRELKDGGAYAVKYNFNAVIGYKFRLQPQEKKHFYDWGINVGAKGFTYKMSLDGDTDSKYNIAREGSYQYCYTSIDASMNYWVYKGLNAGLGVEPTYYFYENYTRKAHFDIPLTGRVAYNFKYVELAFIYKYGLCNVLKSDDFSSGKFQDWALSLYIPF